MRTTRRCAPILAPLTAIACVAGAAGHGGFTGLETGLRVPRAMAQTAIETIVTLTDAQRRTLGSIRGAGDRLTVHDPTGAVVARLVIESDRVKLRDPGNADRWKVKRKDYGAEIEDGAGQRLFRIRRDGGQDWKVEGADKQVTAKLKAKPAGVEVRGADGRTIAKAKRRDGHVVLETESGTRTHEIGGSDNAEAAAWLALDRFTFAERAALWAYFTRIQR